MNATIHRAAVLALLAAGSCVTPGAVTQSAGSQGPTTVTSTPVAGGTLYGRDGKPVLAGPPIPEPHAAPEPKRELGENEGSRASLLELYTKAVEEKAALLDELAVVKMTLDKERTAVAEGVQERAVLRGEMTKLIRERDALQAETMDLAARLTTAQIARLEAQKELLQLQIEIRIREETAAAMQSAPKEEKKHSGGGHK